MRILIAEDDTTSRIILDEILTRLGHEVVAVTNGQEAWATFQQDPVSLVISDWMMPDLNGLELCRRIRAESRPKYTYIILLTALEGKASYLEAMEAGADDFATKPLDSDQLHARLRVAERILGLQRDLVQLELSQPFKLLAGIARREDQPDGLREKPPREEGQDTSRGPVQPLRVIDYAEQGTLLCDFR